MGACVTAAASRVNRTTLASSCYQCEGSKALLRRAPQGMAQSSSSSSRARPSHGEAMPDIVNGRARRRAHRRVARPMLFVLGSHLVPRIRSDTRADCTR